MIRKKIGALSLLAGFGLVCACTSLVRGQIVSDVMIRYSMMNITEAKVGG